LRPDKAYSPASIAKAYLKEMRIKKPKQHFRAPNKMLEIAMQSYYGGPTSAKKLSCFQSARSNVSSRFVQASSFFAFAVQFTN
jgi:hypothetical protein